MTSGQCSKANYLITLINQEITYTALIDIFVRYCENVL